MLRSLSNRLFNLCCAFICFISTLALIPRPLLFAADITLAWYANDEPDIEGYYIYYKTVSSGTPYNGTGADEGNSPIQVPFSNLSDSTNPRYTIHGLSDTETSFFVISAYDTDGNESSYSKEVSYQPVSASTLNSLSIGGTDIVNESSYSNYTATAIFSDGSIQTVTSSATWSEDSPFSQINSSGKLTTSNVSNDTTATIQASYSIGGVTRTATKVVTIVDIPVSVSLSSLSISGNGSVVENSSASYTATATFSNGSTQTVTSSATWSENSGYASINTNGLLSTLEVSGDMTVIIQVGYSVGGVTKTASKAVTILDIPVSVSLSSISIRGNSSVVENSSAAYTATATFSDGSTQTVTSSASWSEDSPYSQINASGKLTTSEIPNDLTVTIQASYSVGGVTQTATKMVSIIDVPASNLPPNTPIIAYPENGQMEVAEPLEISTKLFSDPNNDDAHSQSQWQISEQSDFSTFVLDITSDNYLTVLPVPYMILKSNQTYYIRIRFYDAYAKASEWSSSVEFTTTSLIEDLNSNGISDAKEVDDTVDFNLDGIPDNDQPDIIKCVQNDDGSVYIGVEKDSHSISEIEALNIIDPETIADTANKPDDLIFGLISYRLRVNQPGDVAKLTIYFSGEVFASDILFKYDTLNGWYDYSEYTTINDDGQSVTLEIKDGGYGDSDGLENGIIVDPCGLVTGVIPEPYNYSGSDDLFGIKGCFIATAAFGSKFERHVQLLRRFRDLYLMPHNIGRHFVRAYYRYSPPVADFIANHDVLRLMVRWSLIPLIGVSWMLLHFGIIATMLFLFFMGCITVMSYVKIRQKKKLVFF